MSTSSDKKQKEPGILVFLLLSLAAVLALGALLMIGRGNRLQQGNLLLTVYFGLSAFYLADAFRRQLKVNLFSYNTILFAGFALFALFLFGTHAYAAVQSFRDPEGFRTLQLVFSLLNSAKNYMFLTAPLLLLFSIALGASNLALIRHEGRRFVNILGILLALALTLGEVFIGYLDIRSAFSERSVLARALTVNLMAALYLYFECMMVGAIAADLIAAKHRPTPDKDALIVLGCGLKKDGAPTPLLRGRLDLALSFASEQKKPPVFVVSGGQGPDELQSEAAAMRDYLLSKGVPDERILPEDQSCDTAENMRFSKNLLASVMPGAKTAFFTTNYHVFRAGLKARQADLDADGMGASTKWYFWPNAAVREFVGLLTEHRRRQAAVLLTLLAAYAVLTVLAVRWS